MIIPDGTEIVCPIYAVTKMTYVLLIGISERMEYVYSMVCSQYTPCYVDSKSDALGHECQMMGPPIDRIGVLIKGHNDPLKMVDLRGIGESLM